MTTVTDHLPDVDLSETLRQLNLGERLAETQDVLVGVTDRLKELELGDRFRDLSSSLAQAAPPSISRKLPVKPQPSLLRRMAVPLSVAAVIGAIFMVARQLGRRSAPSDPMEPQSAVSQPTVEQFR